MPSTSSTDLRALTPLLAPGLPSLPLKLWAIVLGHLSYGQRLKFGQVSRLHHRLLEEPLLNGLVFRKPISGIEVTSALDRAQPLEVHPLLDSVNRRSGQPDYFFARGTGRRSERPVLALAACEEQATSPPVFSLKVTVWKDNKRPSVWALGDQTCYRSTGITVGDVLEVVETLLSTEVVSSRFTGRRPRYDVAVVAPQGKTLRFAPEARVSNDTAVLHMRPSIL